MIGQPFPSAIFLDTSLVIAAMIDGHVHHAQSSAFVAQLANARTHVHFSSILRLELSQVLTKLARDPLMPAALRRTYQLDRWERRALVGERWLAYGVDRVDSLLLRFAVVTELGFDLLIGQDSLTVIAHFQLRSHDAVHVAAARRCGLYDFATLDEHFRRVTDLRLWLIRDAVV